MMVRERKKEKTERKDMLKSTNTGASERARKKEKKQTRTHT